MKEAHQEIYMRRAFELAALGRGSVSPNPMVGCVIVHNDRIIGEGWHRKYGEAHAEVNAIQSVKDKSLLPESTVYVTLEPCAHHGKTPPCADLLVAHQVKKVVIANTDPNPLVNGGGIGKLKKAGIEVETGLMEELGRELNKRFFGSFNSERPYIILKWAETADGYVARMNNDSKWISNSFSRMLVHKWRTEEDAIMVGVNTAIHDNPRLNAREWKGKDPLRILIDRNLRTPLHQALFDGAIPTVCYNVRKEAQKENIHWIKRPEEDFLVHVMRDLHHRKVQSVIVEGGAALLNALIEIELWDEARVFQAKHTFGEGIAAPILKGQQLVGHENIMDDLLMIYKNSKSIWQKAY
jgi:diaminohydroxyphosphoribosylaminopyrimidine deaminase/5-amino-6-(5-phosphoribosylamino)uracil reductase